MINFKQINSIAPSVIASWLYLVLLFFGQKNAFAAAFDLDQNSTLLFASEAVTESDYDSTGLLKIESASDTLNLSFKVGFGLSSDFRYVRIDIKNGRFNSAFPSTGLVADSDYDSFLVSGGNIGDTFLIVEMSANPAVGPDTLLTLASNAFLWEEITAPLEIQYRLYDSADAAVNELGFLYQRTANLAILVNGIGQEFVHSFEHSVGFNQSFLRFNPSFRGPSSFQLGDATTELASVGKLLFDRLISNDVLLPSTSEIITDYRALIPNLATSNNLVKISGDFSSVRAFLNADNDCDGAEVELVSYSSSKEVFTSIDTLIDYPVFCLEANSKNIKIKRSEYFIDLGEAMSEKLLGSISYDAASVNLPYLTNYHSYKQKLFFVNMAGYPVRYLTVFFAESSVEGQYSPGQLSEGEIAANSTLKINVSDLVEINGSLKRISARVLFDAAPNDVAAGIQTISVNSDSPPDINVLTIQKN